MSVAVTPLAFVSMLFTTGSPQGAQRWAHELVVLDGREHFRSAGAAFVRRSGYTDNGGVELRVGRPPDPPPGALDWSCRAGPFFPAEIGSAWFVSAPIACSSGFQQLLLSWNVDCPELAWFCVELRVRDSDDAPWSPWLYVGDWAAAPSTDSAGRSVAIDGAKIDVDFFTSERTWSAAQFRVLARARADEAERSVIVRRVALCFSRRTDEPAPSFTLPTEAIRRIDVPFRSQKTERPEIAGRICSPTSVAMALAYRGLEVDTLAAAERIFDSAHDIYGNWTRAIQGAYSFGAPGYLARFSDWNEVARHIADGTPLVISIAAKQGELDGAPYPKTAGHLLVLCGFDEKGDVHVNDPAASTPQTGQLVYRRDQLERVWMARGGTSYVILAPRKD